jgi:hypothetical protein
MSAGLLKVGDTLVAVHRGAEHQAIVLDDGRIKLAGGEPFSSLSRAAAYAKRTKSAKGWEFWQLQTRRERRPLKELHDELIRGNAKPTGPWARGAAVAFTVRWVDGIMLTGYTRIRAKIAELNRSHTPGVGAVRLSFTRGTVTSTSPALVSISRLW